MGPGLLLAALNDCKSLISHEAQYNLEQLCMHDVV